MRTYRVITRAGAEVATLQAANVAELIATAAPMLALLEADAIVYGPKVVARRELWAGGLPGWSLVA